MIRSFGTVIGGTGPDGLQVETVFGAGDGTQVFLTVSEVGSEVSLRTEITTPKKIDDLIEVFLQARDLFKTVPRKRRRSTNKTVVTNVPESQL